MNPITVTALSSHIAALVERDDRLRDVWVLGEISNWKRAASGHIYFSLKDGGATIGAVMWKGSALTHSWLPKEGDQIVAHGYVGVYPERGVYQIYVNRISPAGRGQLYEQFELLKARLAAEGLFDNERKRPLVSVPKRLGIITSADGAALRDILRVLSGRWPLVEVVVFPTLVQGSEAPAQIVAALDLANQVGTTTLPIDTLILARGGGSIEDLWSFNHESVVQAVARSQIPLISGVGHETDATLVDFVADVRAPTPSAAAMIAVPDRTEVLATVAALRQRLPLQASELLIDARYQLRQLENRLQRLHPQRQLDQQRQRLDERNQRLLRQIQHRLTRHGERVRAAQLQLQALNPLAVLARGFSLVQQADGTVVTDPAAVAPGEILRVRAAGGEYLVKREL